MEGVVLVIFLYNIFWLLENKDKTQNGSVRVIVTHQNTIRERSQ